MKDGPAVGLRKEWVEIKYRVLCTSVVRYCMPPVSRRDEPIQCKYAAVVAPGTLAGICWPDSQSVEFPNSREGRLHSGGDEKDIAKTGVTRAL
jgi:hypothetical protein